MGIEGAAQHRTSSNAERNGGSETDVRRNEEEDKSRVSDTSTVRMKTWLDFKKEGIDDSVDIF